MLPSLLLACGVGIVLLLGTIHLIYTFTTNRFNPRDAGLADRMREVAPVISKQTTMWRAWIGFNASHSLGAMLFGLVYGYLALFQPSLLFGSAFLLAVGALFLASYWLLARRYWFNIPFAGVSAASVLYAAGVAFALA